MCVSPLYQVLPPCSDVPLSLVNGDCVVPDGAACGVSLPQDTDPELDYSRRLVAATAEQDPEPPIPRPAEGSNAIIAASFEGVSGEPKPRCAITGGKGKLQCLGMDPTSDHDRQNLRSNLP